MNRCTLSYTRSCPSPRKRTGFLYLYQTAGRDESVNNGLVALLIFGEGWHNHHHAFPASARHGLRWYQVDVALYAIWLLQKVGLAGNVRLPKKQSLRTYENPEETKAEGDG